MAESQPSSNDQGLSATDYADLQHIGSQLPQGHPVRAKIDAVLSKSQPNAGLAGPSAPGPVANVAPTEGPLARSLTAGENRIADIHDQGVAQQKNEQHNFMTNGPIPSPIHLQNPINAIVNPEAQQRFSEGDVAGGLGETGANLAVLEAGRRMGGGEPLGSKMTPENLAAPIRGAVNTGNAILKNPTVQKVAPYAGTAVGYAAGEALGHPWMGAGAGGAIGRAIKGGVTIPGERLGLPPEPPSYDQSVFDKAAAQPKSELFDPMSVKQGTPQPPDRGSNLPRGPIQGPANKPNVTLPDTGPMKADVSKLGPPAGVGKYQPPERIPPPVRTAPIRTSPEPVAEATPRMSVQDQIGLAKSLGYRNVGEAMTKLGGSWDAMVNGLKPKPAVAEPPSVQPGSPTPFHSDAPLTPSDLMNSRMSTRIPTWDEVERQGAKERFYAQAPQVKTKNQLVNEVQPSMVAKSEANTSPYDRNLPTKKIRK